MYTGRDFDPAEMVEYEPFTFDFIRDMITGETIIGSLWTIVTITGSDSSSASRLIGPPNVSGTRTSQVVSGLQTGVRYKLEAVVQTSLGYTRALHSFCVGI